MSDKVIVASAVTLLLVGLWAIWDAVFRGILMIVAVLGGVFAAAYGFISMWKWALS